MKIEKQGKDTRLVLSANGPSQLVLDGTGFLSPASATPATMTRVVFALGPIDQPNPNDPAPISKSALPRDVVVTSFVAISATEITLARWFSRRPRRGRRNRHSHLLNSPMIFASASLLKCKLKPTTAADVSTFTSSLSIFTANTVKR